MSSCAAEAKWDCWRIVSVLAACSSMTQHWNTLCIVYTPVLYISLLYILPSECTKKMPRARNKFHGKAVVRGTQVAMRGACKQHREQPLAPRGLKPRTLPEQ